MKQYFFTAILAALLSAANANAGLINDQSASVTRSQLSLTTTDLGNGFVRWTTLNRWTNNSLQTIFSVYFLYLGQSVSTDGGTTLLTTQWNNANGKWTVASPALTATPVGSQFRVLLSDTNVSIPSGNGLSPASSVAAYSIGTLLPGQSIDVAVIRDITSGVNVITGTALTAVSIIAPEPSTLLLMSGGLLAAWSLRRRRW